MAGAGPRLLPCGTPSSFDPAGPGAMPQSTKPAANAASRERGATRAAIGRISYAVKDFPITPINQVSLPQPRLTCPAQSVSHAGVTRDRPKKGGIAMAPRPQSAIGPPRGVIRRCATIVFILLSAITVEPDGALAVDLFPEFEALQREPRIEFDVGANIVNSRTSEPTAAEHTSNRSEYYEIALVLSPQDPVTGASFMEGASKSEMIRKEDGPTETIKLTNFDVRTFVTLRIGYQEPGKFSVTPFVLSHESTWQGDITRKDTGTRIVFSNRRKTDLASDNTGYIVELGPIQVGTMNGTEVMEVSVGVPGMTSVAEKYEYPIKLKFAAITIPAKPEPGGFGQLLMRSMLRPFTPGTVYDLGPTTDYSALITFGERKKKGKAWRVLWSVSVGSDHRRSKVEPIYQARFDQYSVAITRTFDNDVELGGSIRQSRLYNQLSLGSIILEEPYNTTLIQTGIKRRF